MSIIQIKSLLQKHGINPNKLLGQNFLEDASLFPKLSEYASISPDDIVLDIGAGFGFLTRFLAERCKSVIAVEKDPRVFKILQEQVTNLSNVQTVKGDILKIEKTVANKVVSVPPYYLSSNLVTWLIDRFFDCSVLILQKEFALKLVASPNTGDYSWITVITALHVKTELFELVPNWMFYPPPEVDSIILRLTPWSKPYFNVIDEPYFRRLVRWVFNQRNKKIQNSLVPFLKINKNLNKFDARNLLKELHLPDKRVAELSPEEFGSIADALI